MVNRFFFTALILIVAVAEIPCFGQQGGKLPDSLEVIFKRPDDSIKVDILNKYIIQIREGDNVAAMDLAVKARELAKAIDYKKGLAGALANIGWIYYRQGDFPAALENTTHSLTISDSLRDDKEIGNGLNNLASIYVEQKDYPKALQTFKKALTWAKRANEKFIVGRSFNNIAYVFFLTHVLDSAKRYAEAGISETKGYSEGFGRRTLGDIYVEENKPEEAELNYLKSIAIADSNKSYSLKVSTMHRLGKLYLGRGKTERAIKLLKASETLCKKFWLRNELANTYKVLASAYQQYSNFASASTYFEKYISLNDSLYNEARSKQIALLENIYNGAKIDLLTKENQLKDKAIKSQRLKSLVAVGGLIVFVAFAFLLNRSNQRIKSVNAQLEKKNKEISERGEELKAQTEELSRLNNTKDKLFSIISHDLRGPLNSLSGLLQLEEKGFLSEEEFRTHITALTKNTNRTKELVDNLLFWSSTQLKKVTPNPQQFDIKALSDSVILLYEKQFQEKAIRVTSGVTELSVWADADMIALVLRNLISNALKFSKSGGVIAMGNEVENQQVKYFVKDDGIGLSKEMMSRLFSGEMLSTKGTENEAGTGLGIQLCIDFVNKNGGRLWVDSVEGVGSTFWFTLPLPA